MSEEQSAHEGTREHEHIAFLLAGNEHSNSIDETIRIVCTAFDCEAVPLDGQLCQLSDHIEIVVVLLLDARDAWTHEIDHVARLFPARRLVALVDREKWKDVCDLVASRIHDVILFPDEGGSIIRRIKRALPSDRGALCRHIRAALSERPRWACFIGDSPEFLASCEKMFAISSAESPVLIEGETGTGKELAARAIHCLGKRRDKPFIPVNCGAIPDNLFENELFGHARGAYTDASTDQQGLLSEANGGTLFLDEINRLSEGAQVKLLRFLEDGAFKPLGSKKFCSSDVRIISASNAPLRREMEAGRFRSDLFYRINVVSMEMPPLRKRRSDIRGLAAGFLEHQSQKGDRAPMYFSEDAIISMEQYDWPGNIRELKSVVEQAIVMTSSSIIHASDLQCGPNSPESSNDLGAPKQPLEAAIRKFECNFLLRALESSGWNTRRAAELVQMHQRSFQRLIKKHNIGQHSRPQSSAIP